MGGFSPFFEQKTLKRIAKLLKLLKLGDSREILECTLVKSPKGKASDELGAFYRSWNFFLQLTNFCSTAKLKFPLQF